MTKTSINLDHVLCCRTGLRLSLLVLVGVAGGCSFPLVEVAELDPSFIDVIETHEIEPGLRRVTFIDRQADIPEVLPMSQKNKKVNPCAESTSYKLYNGGVRWAASPVTYRFDSVTSETWKGAVRRAFATWNAEGTSLVFQEDINSQNVITWSSIDGPGRTLAWASFSYRSKQIVKFSITFDSNESWGIVETETCPVIPGSIYDIENTAVHEIGHVLGLAHVGGGKDRALTMYPMAQLGETHKRSLGVGDKAGLAKLYRR